jgi:hypothetical protein
MPNKTTILALASAAVTASAALASALLEEYGGEAAPETAAPAAGGEAATSKRGRPAAAKAATGKTLDELKEIIAPLVKGAPGFPGAGAKIKAIIKDLGVEALKDLPADKQEDFLAAIKPLQEELEAASI